MKLFQHHPFLLPALLVVFFIGCNDHSALKRQQLVADPGTMDGYVQHTISDFFTRTGTDKGKLDDSTQLKFLPVVEYYYGQNDYMPVWSSSEKWKQAAVELIGYLKDAALDGLFREDYRYSTIIALKGMMDADSLKRADAVLWAKADMVFTDAFMHIIQDLKQGRLQPDSMCWMNRPVLYETYFGPLLKKIAAGELLHHITDSLQPNNKSYRSLRSGIKNFIDSMDPKTYTYIDYPYKGEKDSVLFIKKLRQRLEESGISTGTASLPDSAQLNEAIKKYQHRKGIKAEGKVSAALVKMLNLTDKERFRRIAVTLDRYKQLPEKMPEKYIWINLPAFNLKLYDADTVVLESKIICGKPATPTPIITSDITDMMIYPTWTIPTSIISKETLPALKRNPGYLARKGFYLLNNKGERVDPYQVNWEKYTKGIPFLVQQGSGDDNALGVIKFNFNNPYSVYLHDTNQRYLFNNSMRSLSHGCVRVQEWQKLAFYLVRNDSILSKQPDSLKYNSDSIISWIAAKQRHKIPVKNKVALFIRYFGCEFINGAIKFYDDIYGEDKALTQKYFAGK